MLHPSSVLFVGIVLLVLAILLMSTVLFALTMFFWIIVLLLLAMIMIPRFWQIPPAGGAAQAYDPTLNPDAPKVQAIYRRLWEQAFDQISYGQPRAPFATSPMSRSRDTDG